MGKQFSLHSAETYSEPCQESEVKPFQSLAPSCVFDKVLNMSLFSKS